MKYEVFLKNKVIIAEDYGFEINADHLSPLLKDHQRNIVDWALHGEGVQYSHLSV